MRYLKSGGYRLPLDDRTDKDPLPDLAIDVLGTFLRSKKERPFLVIFDYFARHKIIVSPEADKELLMDELFILLRGFISQEVFRIRAEHFPQAENLKRRFKDILRESAYHKCKGPDGNDCVGLKSEGNNLRPDRPVIPLDQLMDLVRRAAMKTVRRSDWCMQIMIELEDMTSFQNCVPVSDLLTAVVRINAELVEVEGMISGPLSTPVLAHIENEISKTRKRAVDHVRQNLVEHFVLKKRLTHDDSGRLISACALYLEDLGATGDTDKIPEYFRETMPPETHDRYLKDYKYLFESIIESALKYFREELRNNPTIRAHGYYIRDEE